MKKNLLWMAAAVMVSGFTFTSCAVDDLPVAPGPEDHWEKATTAFDFEEGDNTVFTATSRMSVAIQDNAENGSKVLALINAGNTQNGYAFAYYNFADQVMRAAKVTIKFDYYNTQGGRGQLTIGDGAVRGSNGAGAGFGKNTYGAKGAIIRMGSDKNNAFVNDSIIAQADFCNKWLSVTVVVRPFDRQVEATITDADENVIFATEEPMGFWKDDANDCTQIDVFGFINSNVSYIDNVSVESAINPDIKFYDYKVRYVDPSGNEIKESVVRNGREGTAAVLLESDKAPIYNAENTVKWVYDSDDAETSLIKKDGVVTIKFKDSGKYTYRLNLRLNDGSSANGYRTATINGEQFNGDTHTEFYKIAYKSPNDGKWYVAAKQGSYEGRYYTFTGNETENSRGERQMDVMYEKVDSIVWIGDFEDKEAMTLVGEVTTWVGWTELVQGVGHFFDRFSQGAGPRLTNDSYFIINDAFEGGNYKIRIYGRNGNSEGVAQAPALYYIPAEGGDPVKIDIEVPTTAGGIMMDVTLENVAIPAGAKLVIMNDGNASDVDLDHISICMQP